MIDQVSSKNGVAIRLTDERWAHITEEHCELAGLRSELPGTTRFIEGSHERERVLRARRQGALRRFRR